MNVTNHLERGSRISSEKTALIFEGKSFTYAELNQKVNQVTNLLPELGVHRGDRSFLKCNAKNRGGRIYSQ